MHLLHEGLLKLVHGTANSVLLIEVLAFEGFLARLCEVRGAWLSGLLLGLLLLQL